MYPAPQIHCTVMHVDAQAFGFAIGAPFKRELDMFAKFARIDWPLADRDLVRHSHYAGQAQNGAFSIFALAPIVHISLEGHPTVTYRRLDRLVRNQRIPFESIANSAGDLRVRSRKEIDRFDFNVICDIEDT